MHHEGPPSRRSLTTHLFQAYVKLLSKKMKENGVPDPKIDVITKGIRSYAQKKMKRFQDYEPYVGESFASESM